MLVFCTVLPVSARPCLYLVFRGGVSFAPEPLHSDFIGAFTWSGLLSTVVMLYLLFAGADEVSALELGLATSHLLAGCVSGTAMAGCTRSVSTARLSWQLLYALPGSRALSSHTGRFSFCLVAPWLSAMKVSAAVLLVMIFVRAANYLVIHKLATFICEQFAI